MQTTIQLVVIVPGIRDRGVAWTQVKGELESAGFSVTIAGWAEYFGVLLFLIPAPLFRRAAMQRLSRRIRDAIQANTLDAVAPDVSYIAHSFGSYILCHLLRRDYHLKTARIILCGSVLPRSFKFSGFEERFSGPILNEVGAKDRLPLLASCVTFGYGTVGTFGYAGDPVKDRFHRGAGHGHFSREGFATTYWVPFLRSSGRVALSPPGDLPEAESLLRASVTRTLQVLKWPAAGFLIWLALTLAATSICSTRLVPVPLQWERATFAWLNVAIGEEVNRLNRQSQHACAIASQKWPEPATVTRFDGRLLQLVACGSEASTNTAAPQARRALQNLAAAFPHCISLTEPQVGALELVANDTSGSLTKIDIPGEAPWYTCGCSQEWQDYLFRQRTGRNR